MIAWKNIDLRIVFQANISNHFKYINSNITFINKQIKEKQQLLKLGTDTASVELLTTFSKNASTNLNLCQKTLKALNTTLQDRTIQATKSADLIDVTPKSKITKWVVIVSSSLMIFGGIRLFYKK